MDRQSPSAEQVSQFVRAANKASTSVERVKRSPTALDQALWSATQGAGRVILAEPDDLAAESLAHLSEDCRIELFDCAHEELPEMRREVLAWMDRYLVGPGTNPQS